MRKLLIAALMAAGPALSADLVAKNGGDVIRITDKPCPVQVLKRIQEGHRGYFRGASAIVDGKNYLACWAAMQDGTVFLQYEDGDNGVLPLAWFKVDEGV